MSKEEEEGGVGSVALETIALVGKHVLEVSHDREENVLRVLSPDGKAGLWISVTAQGISLQVTGAEVLLRTAGKLAIDAEELSLHGRASLSITTDGDAKVKAAGDFSSEARTQNITARLGNVNVRANDDVSLDGERVRLNSPSVRPLTPKRGAAGPPPPSLGDGED